MLEKSKFMLRSLLTVWLLEAAQRCLPCPACAAAGKRPACGWLIFSHPHLAGVTVAEQIHETVMRKIPQIVRAESASSIVCQSIRQSIGSLPTKYIS